MRNEASRGGGTAAIGARDLVDVAVAIWELALARVRIGWRPVESYVQDRTAPATAPAAASALPLIRRVSAAIDRAHRRVPWRSDCLIQAVAAQKWLRRRGVATVLKIGIRKIDGGRIDAHAWLRCGPVTVTGGDTGEYLPLFPENTAAGSRRSRAAEAQPKPAVRREAGEGESAARLTLRP